MKILFAADGSSCTKKALAFLVTHDNLSGPGHEVVVLNVQPAVPPRVRSAVGAEIVQKFHEEEAQKVLGPIRRFMDKHEIRYRAEWQVGHAADQILRAAKRTKAHVVVMGTHGHGALGRALLGSVAQKVLAGAEVPVLLVK
ncbi:universal stress protein [Ramlibacter sp. AW1]|uniref:Universal stress protein n=1 Tax=Ramlibacter aurantiacus TaxID=2801330 RepID=A0A936ZUX4_9BURK|nr:universal stress protein [Ramlibacter aurantiacus]MBL0421034.1 universal stress protein [Ramlibacter aurantiacus]